MTWHADAVILDRYVRGDLGDVAAASVEAHVTGCEHCLSLAVQRADSGAVGRIKAGLDEQLDAPPVGWTQRVMDRVGVNDRDARLVAGALSLQTSWCAASLLVICFALATAALGPNGTSLAIFLAVAPLVPLASIAAAFGPRVDPTFELTQASPMPAVRVVLVRALSVLALTVPLLVAFSLPFGQPRAFGWLLPALALVTATLAAGTFVPLTTAAAGLAGLWVVGVAIAVSTAPRLTAEALARNIVVLRWSGQLTCAAVAAISLAMLAARHHTYEVPR